MFVIDVIFYFVIHTVIIVLIMDITDLFITLRI